MNATEDGMEPVGEAPPINPLSIEPAAWMNAFAAIAEIRELHGDLGDDPDYPNTPPMCRECCEYQPCATNKAFDSLNGAQRYADGIDRMPPCGEMSGS